MKLEIDLDLERIDYDAINKQIQEKIAEMDIENVYQIKSKVDSSIANESKRLVTNYLEGGGWYHDRLDEQSKVVVKERIKELVQPHVDEMFSQIPKDELDKLVVELAPKILVQELTGYINGSLFTREINLQNICVAEAEGRIKSMLNVY